ncbi:MAG: hypothetical protein M3O09_03320 [Acidobacteriota bacterium]|nr:hypothetical protein [Acidobacteriota bacterium]
MEVQRYDSLKVRRTSLAPANDEELLIAQNKLLCPACNGRKTHHVPDGLSQCHCAHLLRWWGEFSKNVPPHDLFVDLATLQPNDKSRLPAERQQKIIVDLRKDPLKSYAFFGPAGTSKTTFSVGLYRIALHYSPYHTWRISAKTLMDEYVTEATTRESNGKPPKPTVNRAKIACAATSGKVPRLFLEEIDKVKLTEFKINSLFEIFDAMYENQGQLVFNTNMTIAKFGEYFGPETGPAMVRRVGEMCEIYDFYEDVRG